MRATSARGPLGRASGETEREREHVVVRQAAPHEARADSFLARQPVAAEDERGRALPSDPFPQAPQVTTAGVDADVEEPRIEASVRRGEHDVARERKVHAGPDRGSGDDRDRRNRRGREPQEAHVRGAEVEIGTLEVVDARRLRRRPAEPQ